MLGREAELVDAVAALRAPDVRWVTISGPTGVGKSHLAAEVVVRSGAEWAAGVVVVDLAPVDRPDGLLPAVSEAVGVRPGGDDALTRLRHVLTDEDLLLVLHNLEHLRPAVPELHGMVRSSLGAVVLATSQVPLRLPGEHVVPLRPLAVPPRGADLARLRAAPAVRLLLDRTEAQDGRFTPTAHDVRAAAEVARLVDGLPLGLELAAARTRLVPLPALARQLARSADALDLLGGGDAEAPERHRSLRAALRWTCSLLARPERELLAALGVFAGPVSLDAAVTVSGLGLGELLDRLSALVDAHLVEPVTGAGDEPRFRLPPMVRWYAFELLAASGRRHAVLDAHATHYAAVARGAARAIDDAREEVGLAVLGTERLELDQALVHLLAGPDAATALRLTADLAPLALARGEVGPALGLLDDLLAHGAAGVPDAVLADARLWAAALASHSIDGVDAAGLARQRWEAGMQVARSSGAVLVVLRGLATATRSLPVTRDFPRAAAAAREGRAIAERAGHARWLGRFEAWGGMVAHQGGDLETAVRLGTSALERARRCGDRRALVMAGLLLDPMEAGTVEVPGGLPTLEEMREMCVATGDVEQEVHVLAALAARADGESRPVEAARWTARRLDLVRRSGAWHGAGPSLLSLSVVAARRGEWVTATRWHGSVLALLPVLRGVIPPRHFVAYERLTEQARATLGPEEFDRIVRAAALVPLPETVGEALRYARAVTEAPDGPGDATVEIPVQGGQAAAGSLTARELEVLRLLASGDSNNAIAARLGLTTKTVMHHSSAIYRKLKVRGRAEATAWAYRHGVMDGQAPSTVSSPSA